MRPAFYYDNLFASMRILDAPWVARDLAIARSVIEENMERYRSVEDADTPWVTVALIHFMECHANFDHQILNGERWDRQTRYAPKGLGPWKSWDEAAREALVRHTLTGFTVDGVLRSLEHYNGWGYAKRKVHSPYLWSGSNWGSGSGKFISDGIYDPKAQSKQVGGALILHRLIDAGLWTPG